MSSKWFKRVFTKAAEDMHKDLDRDIYYVAPENIEKLEFKNMPVSWTNNLYTTFTSTPTGINWETQTEPTNEVEEDVQDVDFS